MARINYRAVLSLTEPNHQIFLRFRQDDTQTQTLSVEITANGKLFPFTGYAVEFVNITRSDSGQPIIEKVEEVYPQESRIEFTLGARSLQWLGKNVAYFSFRDEDGNEVFSTNNFEYEVVHGVHKGPILDSGYLWQVDEIIERIKAYMVENQAEWEKFVEDNREFLESFDPGGKILTEIIDARGNYNSLAERLAALEKGQTFSVPKGAEQVPIKRDKLFYDRGAYNYIRPTNLDTVIAQADKTKFNMGFMTDIHVDSHQQFSERFDTKTKMERRWNIVGQFRTLETFADAMVYGGDNIDGYSGATAAGIYPYTEQERRAKNLHVLKRFASAATAGAKVPVILCRGNHETGKIPHANDGRSRLDSLTGSDIAVAYDSRYGATLFPSKKVAIYRIDTDDFEDHTNSQGKFIEFSGYYNGAEFPHGKLGQNQLHAFGQWLEQLDRSYHVVIVGHVPIERENDVANVTKLATLLDGFKQGTSVTIDYNSMQGYNPSPIGQKTYNFATKGRGTVVAIFAGHWHYETVKYLGTTQIIVGTKAFPSEEEYNTANEAGFANVQIDTAKRTIKVQGIGHYTNRNFSY
ncbi:BppU family phage baseplate upper protein [Enterococcus sp. GC40]|uniref:BppU family phage baseplate upper protein n=1 Tax=Enterococcus sp. GC40 TaxID=3231359 RepID=UPI0034A00D29